MTMRRLEALLFWQDTRGVSAIEFAMILPLFMTLGMYGAEIAWMNATATQVSEVALSLADNASRLGQTDNSGVTPTISTADVDSVLKGALEEGKSIDLSANGRVMLSSLEVHPVTGKQYVHWQQCKGQGTQQSSYGKPDLTGSALSAIASGITVGGRKLLAPNGSAVMVAEVWYRYEGLFGTMFVKPITIREEAAIIVRDDRSVSPGLTGPSKGNAC